MDRRLLIFVASIALLVGVAGYALAQSRSSSDEVINAAPVTLLPPQASTTSTTTPAPVGTTRSTLPPTPSSEVFLYAAGGGCTPGSNKLPDGEYYGSVVINDDNTMDFNLKCLFLAADLPENFDELFTDRFPGETFPGTGADLIDPAAVDRTLRYLRRSEFIIDGGLYQGDEAPIYYVNRGGTPLDVSVVIEEGLTVSIVEFIEEDFIPG